MRSIKLTQAPNLLVSTTVSLETGRHVVALRPDNGWDDDTLITPAQARHLAAALIRYAEVVEQKQRRSRMRRGG